MPKPGRGLGEGESHSNQEMGGKSFGHSGGGSQASEEDGTLIVSVWGA